MPESKRHPLLRYLRFARPYKWTFALIVAAGVAKFTLPLIPADVIRRIIDHVIRNDMRLADDQRMHLLWWLGGVLVAVSIAQAAAIYIRGSNTVKISTRIAFDLRQSLWRHLQRLSLGFHTSRPTGSLLSRLMSDIDVSQQMMQAGIINVCIDAVSGSVALWVLFSISWKLTLLALAILPIYAVLYRRLNPRIRQASREVQEQRSIMSGLAVERLGGIAVVQTFAQEPAEQARFANEADELRGRAMHRGLLAQVLAAFSELLVALAANAVWVVGAYLAVRGELTPGEIIKFTAVAALLYLPIRRFSELNIIYQTSMAAIERVFGIFDVVPEVRSAPGSRDEPPASGGIEFHDVSFRYPHRPPALREISFAIPPGQRVAIVGESGAGKSTLVTLIPRLYDVSDGRICIDGVDIRDYRLRPLRRSIGIVLQESILFSGTVSENLRYGREDATDDEIVAAAEAANAHEFISRLPQGYDTVIGERGVSLSGGQRQRISIGRTLLQDPRILILDEATSSLDSESENLINEALDRVMVGRTCLIIAHRLSTVIGSDRILVLRDGQLVEDGPHAQLLEAGGYYRHLFEEQFGTVNGMTAPAGGHRAGGR